MKLTKIASLFLIILIIFPFYICAKDYKGAELRTTQSYLYGRFEVRYKSTAGSGQTSTFFLYNNNYPNTPWNEIDIEILGRYTDDVQFNTITPGIVNHVRHQFVDFNPQLDFHNYAIEWTPEYVAWYIDSVEVYRQTGEHIASLKHPQKIMMNIWNPVYEGWVGIWNEKILPKFAYYDFVSYSSYTPGSGNCGTDNNFTHQWIDNFDNWDQSRWQKATHTFSGNNCNFTPENIVFKDGNMILCLTDNTNLGYVDKNPPTVLWARANKNTVEVSVKFSEKLTRTTAENPSNFLISSGVAINSAFLLEDKRTVVLSTSELELTSSYSLYVFGIEDRAFPANRLLAQSVTVIMPDPLSFPVKINIGGNNAYDDYLPEQEWSESVEYGYLDGTSQQYPFSQPISGTENDDIYLSERYGLVKYNIRVPHGKYKITMMMAENYFTEEDKRVFDIFLEGDEVAKELDIFQQVGKNTAYDIVVDNVEIKDGIIDIHFCAVKNYPLLNGLIIEAKDTKVGENLKDMPDKFYLAQNYPNPFNSSTIICYMLPEDGYATLAVYDILGKKINQLFEKHYDAGIYQFVWNPDLPSGIYFYQMKFSSAKKQFTQIRKLLLLQ